MEQEQQEQPKYRVVPVHTPSLTQALAVAMERDVLVWREVEAGTPYSLKELFEFAQRQDKEHPLTGHQYYMVTTEGAIGISPGLEWLTEWMFVPMEDCQERDFMLMKMREDLQAEHAASEAEKKGKEQTKGQAEEQTKEKAEKKAEEQTEEQTEKKAKGQAIAEEQSAPVPPVPPAPPSSVPAGGGFPASPASVSASPASPAQMNFCPNCGVKLVPGNRFCTQCGHRLM